MTTRRRLPAGPPPPRGRSGRFGLLPPLAMGDISVKTVQLGSDTDLLPQHAREHPAYGCALEAGEVAARVGTAPRLVAAGDEHAVAGGETDQFALRRAPAAADAAPHRFGPYDSSVGCSAVDSTGMPAGTSSGSATSASGETSGSSSATASASASSTSTASTSASSVSAGGPAT